MSFSKNSYSFPNKKILVFISEYLLSIKYYIIILGHGTSSISQVIPDATCSQPGWGGVGG
jgi:hypothetical protein